MAEKEKSNLYLLSIVGIVAVVGLVILILGGGQKAVVVPTQIGEEAIAGEAISSLSTKTTIGKPDLQPVSVNLEIDHGNVVMDALVWNRGDRKIAAGKSFNVQYGIVFYDEDLTEIASDVSSDTITLSADLDADGVVDGAGVTFSIPSTLSKKIKSGAIDSFLVSYNVYVDELSEIREGDESNNGMIWSFSTGPFYQIVETS